MENFYTEFDGADGTPVGSPDWSVVYYAANNFAQLNGSGAIKSIGGGASPGVHRRAETGPDHWAEVVLGAGFAQMLAILMLRMDLSYNGYRLGYYAAGNKLQLFYGSSSISLIADTACTAGDTVRMEVDGPDQIRVYLNGVLKFTHTDARGATNNGVGFRVSTTATDDLIRSFKSGDFTIADTVAPTLTSASASATSGTTSSGSVTTDEANGTLYWTTTTNASETATTVKAGSSQAVTAAGAQSTSSTGLSPGTTYYTHFLHRDAAGNDSAVLSSASFATPALSASITLTTDGTTPAASLTGLTWGWWDAYPPDMTTAPLVGGSSGATNGSGVFTATLTGTTLTTGQTGTLLIVKGDGTEGSTDNNAFCGPVVVG